MGAGHCKQLKPAWVEAAGELKGKMHMGAVDCTQHQDVCSKFGVQVRERACSAVQRCAGAVRCGGCVGARKQPGLAWLMSPLAVSLIPVRFSS